jgi:hypothetical protein
VSTSDDILRAAARRLLTGEHQCTDGALTISNLAREAGVARATAYRSSVVEEFRAAVANSDTFEPVTVASRNQIRELKAQLVQTRRRYAEDVAELRGDRNGLLQLVQALTLERDNLLRHTQSSVSPLTRRQPTTSRRRAR